MPDTPRATSQPTELGGLGPVAPLFEHAVLRALVRSPELHEGWVKLSMASHGPLPGRAAGFHGLQSDDGGAGACLFAFDLLRLNGEDLRTLPLEERQARLQKALRGSGEVFRFSEHLEGDGREIYRHDCALGLEGITSKRDSHYRSDRSPGHG